MKKGDFSIFFLFLAKKAMRRIGYLMILVLIFTSCGNANNFQKQKFTNLKLKSSFTEADEQVRASQSGNEKPAKVLVNETVEELSIVRTVEPEIPVALEPSVELEASPIFENKNLKSTLKNQLLPAEPIDTIFTVAGDTILCKIKSVSNGKINYTVENDGYTTTSSIPTSAAIKYVSETKFTTEAHPARLNADKLGKATKILALSTLIVGIALLILFLLELDFALVLFLIFFFLLTVTAVFFLQTIFKRKIEKLVAEDPVGNAKKIRNKKIQAMLSILAPIALMMIGFGAYIIIDLL